MSKKHNKSNTSKDSNKNANHKNINKSKTSSSSKTKNISDNLDTHFSSNGTSSADYRHDMRDLTLLNDQLYAVYTGILSSLFLIKATQESIDKIVIKYNGGDVENLPDPAKDANLSTILSFYSLLQSTLIGYNRYIQISEEYAEGYTDIDPKFRLDILYGLIISLVNMYDQRMRELNSPYSPVLTPFPG